MVTDSDENKGGEVEQRGAGWAWRTHPTDAVVGKHGKYTSQTLAFVITPFRLSSIIDTTNTFAEAPFR